MDQELANTLWLYEPDSGKFFWRVKASRGSNIGDRAGWFDGRYWRLRYKKKNYKASRIAWLVMTGNWPENLIDHINQNKTDDRWFNLRQANKSENQRNRSARKDNKLGIKGIHKTKYGFMAQNVVEGKQVLAKHFKSLEQAKTAYVESVVNHHGEFAYITG